MSMRKVARVRNIVGQAVSGEDFFGRAEEVDRIRAAVRLGSNILITAPRRVGKTSILYHLMDNPIDGLQFIYVITEAVNSQDQFYERLLKVVLSEKNLFGNATLRSLRILIMERIRRFGFGGAHVELANTAVDHREEFINLIQTLDINNKKIVLMIDEFPQTVENIITETGTDAAIRFLQEARELRHDRSINEKFQFIYTGSIGLENIVAKLNSMKLINDLTAIVINPMKDSEARDFIRALLAEKRYLLDDHVIDYILDKIAWLIPFHIQIFVSELNAYLGHERSEDITEGVVDTVFSKLLDRRNYFEHWRSRLKTSLSKADFEFAEYLLNKMSYYSFIEQDRFIKFVPKHAKKRERAKFVIDTLLHDGYLSKEADPEGYRFNSPILRMWWNKNVAH